MLASITFLLSAVLDNLTTTIVMVSMTRKILADREDRLFFAAMIVVAANAGGAWSPMGDVTTTMLWIGGQVSALGIVKALLLPSIANLIVPLLWATFVLRGRSVGSMNSADETGARPASERERNLVFFAGSGLLLLVPAVKTITHLPVFMAVLLSLAILWIVSEVVHRNKDEEEKARLTAAEALKRIELGLDCVLPWHSAGGGGAGACRHSRHARILARPHGRTS